MYIYILKLKFDKYYIGKTHDVDKRYLQHLNGAGSEWTRTYQPIEMITYFKSDNRWDEDNFTLDYMYKYGIENVRGGRYVKMNFNKRDISDIVRSIDSAYDRCYKCHFSHSISESCPVKIIQDCSCGVIYHQSHIHESGIICHKCGVKVTGDAFYKHYDKCINACDYHCYCCNKRVIIRDNIGYIKITCNECEKTYEIAHKEKIDKHVCKIRKCANCDDTFTGFHTCESHKVKYHCQICLMTHNNTGCMKYLLDKCVKSDKYEIYNNIRFFLLNKMTFIYNLNPKEAAYIETIRNMDETNRKKLGKK